MILKRICCQSLQNGSARSVRQEAPTSGLFEMASVFCRFRDRGRSCPERSFLLHEIRDGSAHRAPCGHADTFAVCCLCIVGMYHLLHDEKDSGTNLVLSAIHSGEEIPLRMAPLIFLSTLITHIGGGSAGREGAALQLGGSIGNSLGRLFLFDEKDQHIMIMCGMSAAFSALFGTPMAAAIFPMEIVSVGIMHYAALVPCVISSFIAHGIAGISVPPPILFSLTGFRLSMFLTQSSSHCLQCSAHSSVSYSA